MGFETYSQDADLSPFFKGLPNDECRCEHMGYVIKGKVVFRSGDEEELKLTSPSARTAVFIADGVRP